MNKSAGDLPSELTIGLDELAMPSALQAFGQSGCLKVESFIDTGKIDTLARAADAAIQSAGKNTIIVGDGRRMLPLPIAGVFDDAAIYTQSELRSFLIGLYGEGFVLNCFTCVNARPGAADQHIHRDYVGLFSDNIDTFCPSFAVNLFVPLVPFNAENGTTRVWPGSHRKPDLSDDALDEGFCDPQLQPGDALLVDYRLRHGGTANHSVADRPTLCLAYARDWFLDTVHYKNINPLQIAPEMIASKSESEQQLFSRAKMYAQLEPK